MAKVSRCSTAPYILGTGRRNPRFRTVLAALLHAITHIVRNLVLRQLVSNYRQEAEDVVQDILMSLHISRATYNNDRPFLPWLAAVARNRIADAARRRERLALHEIIVSDAPETFSEADAYLLDDGYRDPEALWQAINRLPAQQRRVMEMLKLREMSLMEASVVSGMSIGSLKIAVHGAMGALRTRK